MLRGGIAIRLLSGQQKPPMEIPRSMANPFACNPIFGFPIDVSHQTSAEFLQIARGHDSKRLSGHRSAPDGSVGQQRSLDYLDEAYYFVAMYLAQLQQRDGYYIEALMPIAQSTITRLLPVNGRDCVSPCPEQGLVEGLRAFEAIGWKIR